MAPAAERGPDEASREPGRNHRPETWALVLVSLLLALAMVTLAVFAAR
jgi:hypothetical protein